MMWYKRKSIALTSGKTAIIRVIVLFLITAVSDVRTLRQSNHQSPIPPSGLCDIHIGCNRISSDHA